MPAGNWIDAFTLLPSGPSDGDTVRWNATLSRWEAVPLGSFQPEDPADNGMVAVADAGAVSWVGGSDEGIPLLWDGTSWVGDGQTAATSGQPPPSLLVPFPTHTGASNSEWHDVSLNPDSSTATLSGGGGAIATMRTAILRARTYAAAAAQTITKAVGLTVESPVAGTNVTLTQKLAGWFRGFFAVDESFQAGGSDMSLAGMSAPPGMGLLISTSVSGFGGGVISENYAAANACGSFVTYKARGGSKAAPAACTGAEPVWIAQGFAYDGTNWVEGFRMRYVLNAAPSSPNARGRWELRTSGNNERLAFDDTAGTRTTQLHDLAGADGIVHADTGGTLSNSLIVDADVDAAAAIACTKTDGDFGSGLIQTTGDVECQDVTATGTVDAAAVTVTSVLTAQESGALLGFFGATAVVQRSAIAGLTNSTGGSTDGTVAAVSGTGDDTTINNNFADVTVKLNLALTVLRDLGFIAT